MKPNILLDATGLDTAHRTRGIGRYVQGLLEGLSALRGSGALPFELTLLRSPVRAPREEAKALQAQDEGYPLATYPRWIRAGATEMWLENLLRLDAYAPPGVALYHATGMEGLSRRLPWVATCHDLIPLVLRGEYLKPHDLFGRLFWTSYARRLARSACRVVAISQHVKGYLVDRWQVPEARVDVSYHGLSPFWSDPDVAPPSSSVLLEAASEPFVLFVGGFDRRKNFGLVLQALSLLPASARPRLLVVGVRSGEVRAQHAGLGAKLPGVDVRYLEYVDDPSLRWLYRRSLGLVFSSVEEGWGFPIVEAMAAGAPVLCADFGSMAEAGGGAAITVDVRSPEALSSGIARLQDAETRSRAIALGKARVSSLHWESCARELVSTWEKALG